MSQSTNPYASPGYEPATSPGVQWARTSSPSLQKTALGLSLIYYGIIVMLLSIVAMIVLGVMIAATVAGRGGGGAGAGGAFLVLMIPVGLALLVGAILCIVGPIVCLAVPEETNSRGFLIGSVVLQLINFVYSIFSYMIPDLKSPALAALFGILGCVGAVLFLLFLKNLSEYVGRSDLAQRAKNILITGGVLIGLYVIMFWHSWRRS